MSGGGATSTSGKSLALFFIMSNMTHYGNFDGIGRMNTSSTDSEDGMTKEEFKTKTKDIERKSAALQEMRANIEQEERELEALRTEIEQLPVQLRKLSLDIEALSKQKQDINARIKQLRPQVKNMILPLWHA